MAITFNPANTIARAYARPKLAPSRADITTNPGNGLTGVDNRRDAPAVQLRLSAAALAVLAKAHQDAEKNSPTQDTRPSREADKPAFSFDNIFTKRSAEPKTDAAPVPTPHEKPANAYAPPGSRINIVL